MLEAKIKEDNPEINEPEEVIANLSNTYNLLYVMIKPINNHTTACLYMLVYYEFQIKICTLLGSLPT